MRVRKMTVATRAPSIVATATATMTAAVAVVMVGVVGVVGGRW